LHQSGAGCATCAVEQRLHQTTTDSGILAGRIDAHRADADDGPAGVGERSCDDRALALGDDADDAVERKHQVRVRRGELR
jgi:hypothetical protein